MIELNGRRYNENEYTLKDGAIYTKDMKTLVEVDSNLKGNFIIPNSVTSIGSYAFLGCCDLTSITIPDSVTSIGKAAFSSCKGLTSITIPDGVTSIGNYAFDGCKGLTSITIPDSITNIGNNAFRGCTGLTSITISDSVSDIGDWAFYRCESLTSITIPDSVTSIGEAAFYGCTGLKSIDIPNSVTSIDDDVFVACERLTSITIPDSVTSIGEAAFYGCENLTIKCNRGYYAEEYAKKQGINIEYQDRVQENIKTRDNYQQQYSNNIFSRINEFFKKITDFITKTAQSFGIDIENSNSYEEINNTQNTQQSFNYQKPQYKNFNNIQLSESQDILESAGTHATQTYSRNDITKEYR